MSNKKEVLDALSVIIDPDLNKDIVSLGFIQDLKIEEQNISFTLKLTTPACPVKEQFVNQAKIELNKLNWVKDINIKLSADKQNSGQKLDGCKKIGSVIAVASCKGGVGKSTVAVNLAYAIAKKGAKVGLFDADIYGPSFSLMMQLDSNTPVINNNYLEPYNFKGVKLMSLGYLKTAEEDQAPAILRGPMVSQIITQLLSQTQWGELDYLVIDMPPGTGDIHLTIGQLLQLRAAVMVTSPQKMALIDVIKGIEMFDTLNVPTVAAVENFSYLNINGKKTNPFGKGALKCIKQQYGFENTETLPINQEVSESGDNGSPHFLSYPNSEFSQKIESLANKVIREVAKIVVNGSTLPNINYDNSLGILIKYNNETGFHINSKTLRNECICSHCKNELTDEQIYDTSKTNNDIYPLSMNPVGNYALGINWSDGHSSLYPYKLLKKYANK